MVESGETQSIDITKILPKSMPSGQKILCKSLEQNLIFITTDKHGCNGGSRPKPITIKRFISMSELLFEGLGLFLGDGLKLSQGQFKVFGFSNNEIELHRCFIKFSHQCLGLPPFLFRVRVSVPPELQNEIEDLEKMFSRESGIPIENFNKSRVKKMNKPCFEVKFCSVLLGEIIQLLLKNLKSRQLSNKNFAASLLQGLIASEGSVYLGKQKRLEMISIAAKKESERDFMRGLLKILNIMPNKDGDETVLITGLTNFKIIDKWKLCFLHPIKNSKFKLGLGRIKRETFRKGEGKLLILSLLSQEPKTKKQMCKLLNRSEGITYHLLVLEKRGLIRTKMKINNKSKVWEITGGGLEILEIRDVGKKLKSLYECNSFKYLFPLS